MVPSSLKVRWLRMTAPITERVAACSSQAEAGGPAIAGPQASPRRRLSAEPLKALMMISIAPRDFTLKVRLRPLASGCFQLVEAFGDAAAGTAGLWSAVQPPLQ
jgi:hypothetical protein